MPALRRAVGAAAVACSLGLLPGVASAATVSVTTGTYRYHAGDGERNDLQISRQGDDWRFSDPGATIEPQTGCRPGAGPSQALCPASSGSMLEADLGDLADRADLSLAGVYALVFGDGGNDRIVGSSRSGALYGGPGDDDLHCASDCELWGGLGADWMYGYRMPGSDYEWGKVRYGDHDATGVTVRLDGIANDGNASDGPVGARDNAITINAVVGSQGPDYLYDGAGGEHSLYGEDGTDQLYAAPGSSGLLGGSGTDYLYGGAGDDHLWPDRTFSDHEVGGDSGDVVSGGDGVDIGHYDRSSPVAVSLDGAANDGVDPDGDGLSDEHDLFVSDMEGARTGPGNDILTGNSGPNPLDGDSGDDVIRGGGGADRLTGGWGLDTLSGGAQNDVLEGGADADVLTGDAGTDSLAGDAGEDFLDGGAGADAMSGGTGPDTVSYFARTSPLVVTMTGGADDGIDTDGDGVANEGDDVAASVEHLMAGTGTDRVTGNGWGNRISGNDGVDHLEGLDGNDVLDGGKGGDTVDGGSGGDRFPQVKSPDGPDTVIGGTEIDTVDYTDRLLAVAVSLDGAANDGDRSSPEGDNVRADVEAVIGSVAGDILTGAPIDNRLVGGAGDDVLDGGFGADDLVGGRGADTASYAARTGAVTADLDGLPDDGTTADANSAGDRDRIRTDVERLTGGTGADRLTGNAAANQLAGGNGPDILTGGGAVDLLYGGDGDDDLFSRGDGAADTAACQGGTADEVTADAADTVSGCEIAH